MTFQDTGAQAEPTTLDPSDFLAREMRSATSRAVSALDANPDDAARAMQVSDASGVPPAVVDGDLEHYDAQTKAALTTHLLNNNPALQQYVNSHPLAAKISNDDYGKLDEVHSALQTYLGKPASLLGAMAQGFKEDFGSTPIGSWINDSDYGKSYSARYPYSAYLLSLEGGAFEIPARVFSGVIGAAKAGLTQIGGEQFGRDTAGMIEQQLMGLTGVHIPSIPAATVDSSIRTLEPYAKAGVEPPVGVHPLTDAVKVEEAKTAADGLKEAQKASFASATRERNPEMFANYVRGITDGEIGISADAIRELYGDKPPAPDDGLLGFVPDLEAKLAAAEATGGDVQVPIADWLAKVEPEVAKQLEDHIRARPEGMTKEEAKEPPGIEVPATTPVDTVRQSAGLQGIQERKLALQRLETAELPSGNVHHFSINDPTGSPLGDLFISDEKGGKQLYVEDITSPKGPQSLGPKAMRDLLEQIKEQFPEAESLVGMRVSGAREKADKGNVKASIDLTKIRPRAKALPEASIEEKEAFAKASAIGMTVDQYKRYQKLIDQRQAEDAAAAQARAEKDAKRRLTPEWKANRVEVRKEVKDAVLAQPDHELDEMLREGKLKLNPEGLPDEIAAALPKGYVSKDGVHPDDLAGMFGHNTGSELVSRLVALVQARDASGMKPAEFLQRVVDAATDREMESRFGDLDRNILEEAKDQVLSQTQEDLLHEETLARASEAGLEFSIDKAEYKGALKQFFDRQTVRDISSDKGLAEAGRAGRAAEMALLKGDPAEAFRQKQRQYNAIVMANFAKKFEKDAERFDRTAKRFSAREVSGVDQEYTNWVHDILGRVGRPVKRSVQDLQEAIARMPQTSLADFVNYKQVHDMREVPVADFLTDPAFRKRAEDLTTADFSAMHDSVKALVKNGRDEMKIEKAGEAADLAEIKDKMVGQLARFKEIEYDAEGKPKQRLQAIRKGLRTALVSHLQVETVFNRLDRFDPRGVFSQYVFRPLAEAANGEAALLREYSRKLGEIADDVNLRELVPNDIFHSPFDDGTNRPPMQMTRKNLRAVLLNWGNESNRLKLTAGYKIGGFGDDGKLIPDTSRVKAWLDQHATKEDWQWAQKVWDMLEELHQKSNTMYRSMSGVEPEALKITPVETPHGTFDGGYYPLIRHPTFGEDIKLSKNGLEGEGYVRATTPAGYTKARTGAMYPLSLDLDSFPNQLRQVIHDISFRPAVIQAAKILYDKRINTEFKKHLGKEYADMFVPWLRDVANVQNFMSSAQKDFARFSDFMRQNAVTTLVGFNVGTAMKHTPTALISSMAEVGPANFLKAMRGLLSVNEETGENNWQFAMKTSEELGRRSRNWVETMGGGLATLEGRTVGKALAQHEVGAAFMSLREMITELSSKPVALGDLLSAVPTWTAKYQAEMEEHGVHGDAVFAADKSVRQAHGSSAITSRSQVARSRSALAHWMTGFFTFFNDIFNRQVETLWRAGNAVDLAKEGQKAEAFKEATKVAGRLFAYVVAPAMIEELVSPLVGDKNDPWYKTAAKSLAFTLSSSWVGVRDVVSAILNKRDPSVGLLSTVGKSATDTIRDLSSTHPKAGNVIKHGTQLSGMLTGLTPAPIGRAAEFLASKEKPKGPWGWLTGLRYGTLKNHSQTFDQYMKGR